jgi:hypothetical protein
LELNCDISDLVKVGSLYLLMVMVKNTL